MSSFFGIDSKNGIFGGAQPAWVDPVKPAGCTDQRDQLGWPKTIANVVHGRYMFWNPNMVWFTMALALHVCAPYNIEAAKAGFNLSVDGWVLRRLALNFTVGLMYYGFFYVALYVAKAAERKYRPNSVPTAGNMAHNLWYWTLGIVQWTWWEAVVVRLWASGAVSFASDADMLSDGGWRALGLNVAWVLLVPIWRDMHFYVAHRFLHIRAVYTYVHKLHHRNADPEPFSGLCMHPVEHLYYFSCAFTPSIFLSGLSPLILTWNWIHLTISPCAAHSGFEDHFQSDQYHYVHHAKFECNYGSPMSAPIDQTFGTFRESLRGGAAYKGAWTAAQDDNASEAARQQKLMDQAQAQDQDHAEAKAKAKGKAKVWSPHGYLGLPASWDHGVYTLFWVALFPLAWFAANGRFRGAGNALGAFFAYSPTLFAVLLSQLAGDRMPWRWPFHKDAFFGSFGLFVALGWAMCIVPVHHAVAMISEV